MAAVRQIVRDAARDNYRLVDLSSHGVIKSVPFQNEGVAVMIITKKALSRRTVLRGMGATVALPLLDAMVPALSARARRRAATALQRMGFIYIPNGANMSQWTPKGGAGVRSCRRF